MDTNSLFQNLLQMGAIKRLKGRPAAIKEHTLRVRLTEAQLEKLEKYAQKRSASMSEVIRNYISRLPSSEDES